MPLQISIRDWFETSIAHHQIVDAVHLFVLVQLKVGNVSAGTHRTFEVFDVVVVLLMNCQSIAIAESLIADVALMMLLCLV